MSQPSEFVMPKVALGDRVEISRDPVGFSDPQAAIVVAVKSRSIDVQLVTRDGLEALIDCWHRADPRCQTHRDLLLGEHYRGVFDLSAEAVRQQQIIEQIESLRHRVAGLETTLAEQGRRIAALGNLGDAPARRGRPRSVEPVPVGS